MTAPVTTTSAPSALKPIGFICLGYFLFNIGDAALKYLGHTYHFSQLVFFNCLMMSLSIIAAALWRRDYRAFVPRNPKLVALRASLHTVTSFMNVLAFPHVDLTVFYTLVFTSPFWVAILSSLVLGEKIKPLQMAAILTGFAVVFLVFRPGAGLFTIYSLLVMIGAFLYSGSVIVMRKMGPQESRTAIVLAGTTLGMLASLPMMIPVFQMPGGLHLLVFIGMGILSATGLFAVAYAFQNAPSAATVAPFHYTQIVWGTALGYWLFGEEPSARVLIGAAVIIGAGLVLMLAESGFIKRRGRKAAVVLDILPETTV